VDIRYLDLSVTGDAPDEAALEKVLHELADLGPLRLVSNRLSILARLHARLADDTLSVDGWLPDMDSAEALKELLKRLRPDLKLVATALRVSPLVRWPEGEKLPLREDSTMLKPIITALHVPAALEILRRGGKLIVTGMLPSQQLKNEVTAALSQPRHGLAVDVTKLRVSSHVLPAAFTKEDAVVPFLRSFYDTPSPGEFSILPGQNPRLQADTTRTLESAWLSELRPVSGGTKLDMQLTQHPSIYHFPGRRIQTALPEDSLQSVRDVVSGVYVVFSPGSTSISAEERSHLTSLIPALLAAGPALKLVVGGHPEPGGNLKVETQLAQQRAEQVASFLIEQGAPSAEILPIAFDPVPTGDPHAPQQVRSVEILIQ